MNDLEKEALEARTTCLVDGKEMLVYWIELIKVRDDGSGTVVNIKTGKRQKLVWDPESGYASRH